MKNKGGLMMSIFLLLSGLMFLSCESEQKKDRIDEEIDIVTRMPVTTTIHICKGTACTVKGANDVSRTFCEKLGVGVGQSTSNGKYFLMEGPCIGACGLAPLVSTSGYAAKYYICVKPEDVDYILSDSVIP